MTDDIRWRIELSTKAEKQLDRLSPDVAQRLWSFLENKVARSRDPRRLGRKLEGERDIWRYRVGSYRILATPYDDRLVVLVVEVGGRGQVYKHRR